MSNVGTFRKKPVEVQALEFRGWTNAREACEWADAYFVAKGYEHVLRRDNEHDRSTGHVLDHAPEFLVIKTLEGSMRADVGDFVIQGVQGEFYPCKPDIFEATYDKVA